MATKVEDLGFSTLFVADHLDLPAGHPGYPPQHLAVVPAMMAAAAWTTTLEVGARVVCTDYHWPPMLAKEAATIDMLSNGRLLLGLGCGWNADEYENLGITFDEAPRRIDKLEEVVELVKAHGRDEEIHLDGEHVRVHGFRGLPEPASGRHPRLMIGGSKRRVMALAGREADVVSLSNTISPDADPAVDIPRQLGFVREGAGARFDDLDFELMASHLEVTDDIDTALAAVGARYGVDPERLRDHPLVLVGSVGQIADQIERRRADHGINYATVPYHFVDAMAPVVERLAGT
jgi:probable F420-dependent oxidoreductase